jgi:hypothetical protein
MTDLARWRERRVLVATIRRLVERLTLYEEISRDLSDLLDDVIAGEQIAEAAIETEAISAAVQGGRWGNA